MQDLSHPRWFPSIPSAPSPSDIHSPSASSNPGSDRLNQCSKCSRFRHLCLQKRGKKMVQNKSSYTTGEADRTTRPSLRLWLPRVRHWKSLSSIWFFLLVIAASFTAVFLFLEDTQWSKTGSVLSSAFFGLMLNHWWSEFTKGDAQRREAIDLDDRIEGEIQRISEHWQQAIHSLKSLMNEDPGVDFIKASRYFIGLQMNLVRGRIERAALRMDQLGFNSSDFLREKRERLDTVKRGALEVVISMPHQGTDTETDPLLALFITDVKMIKPVVHDATDEGE